MPQVVYFEQSHSDTENTCGPRYGESSPIEILMKVDISNRVISFREGGQKSQKWPKLCRKTRK